MEIENLFQVPIGYFKPNCLLNDEELLYINKELENTRLNMSNQVSNNTYVLRSKELKKLNKFCLDSLNEFTTTIYGQPINLRITQSWLNITKPNEFHHIHSHSNSVISGVYYVQTSESDKIQFEREGGSGSYDIFVEPENLNRWNSKNWWLPTPQNSLILFKSDLKHQVPTVTSTTNRISLSFNTFFSEGFGYEKAMSYVDMRP